MRTRFHATYIITTIFAIITLSGCSTPPRSEKLAALPVIAYQDALKTKPIQPYILHFSKQQSVPIQAIVKGSLLNGQQSSTLLVNLNQDIYTYENWVSFDNQNWKRYDELLQIRIHLALPSTQSIEKNEFVLELNDKSSMRNQ